MLLLIWPTDWSLLYEEIHLSHVLAEEGRDSDQHFVRDDAQRPPV